MLQKLFCGSAILVGFNSMAEIRNTAQICSRNGVFDLLISWQLCHQFLWCCTRLLLHLAALQEQSLHTRT